MLGNLTGWHFLILLVIVLLIFGATRLPALARSLGQSTKILRDELKDGAKEEPKSSTGSTTSTEATPTTTTTGTTSSGSDSRTS